MFCIGLKPGKIIQYFINRLKPIVMLDYSWSKAQETICYYRQSAEADYLADFYTNCELEKFVLD